MNMKIIFSFIIFFLFSFAINLKFSIIAMPLLIFCFFQAFSNGKINMMISKFMMEEKAVKRTVLQVFPNLIAAILSVILVCNMDRNKEYGRIIPMCLSSIIFGVSIFIWYLIRRRKYVNCKYWKYGLAISIPLIFHGLSVNILSSSDRMILTAICDASETGVYSVVYNFGMLATVITASIEGIWIPFFTKKMISGEKDIINKMSKHYVSICTFLFCGLIIIAPEVLVIFASEKYRNGISLIVPIVLASYFQYLYSLAVNTELYYKKTKIIAFNTMFAAGINLVLNFIFIPQYGAFAAAFTTVVAYTVSFGIHFCYCKRMDGSLFPVKMYIPPIMLMVITILFQNCTINFPMVRWIVGIFLLMICFILYCYRNKDFLKNFVK